MDTITLLATLNLVVITAAGLFGLKKLKQTSTEISGRASKLKVKNKKTATVIRNFSKTIDRELKSASNNITNIDTANIGNVTELSQEVPELAQAVRYIRRHRMKSSAAIAKINGSWRLSAKLTPSPHVIKQKNLTRLSKLYDLPVLVETGTQLGNMVDALIDQFEEIYSIELGDDLYHRACARFADTPHVNLIHGDSGAKMPEVVKIIDKPALFWLDGHYSGWITAQGNKDTPIIQELTHVFAAPDLGHVIVIDDARDFTGEKDYPTIDEIESFTKTHRPNHEFAVVDDAIWILPPSNK